MPRDPDGGGGREQAAGQHHHPGLHCHCRLRHRCCHHLHCLPQGLRVISLEKVSLPYLPQSSNKKNRALAEEKPIHTLSMSMNGLNLAGMGPPGHPGAPLAGLASLGLTPPGQKDWDNMSVYRWAAQISLASLKLISALSQKTDRSVNRARMYHMDPRQGEHMMRKFMWRHNLVQDKCRSALLTKTWPCLWLWYNSIWDEDCQSNV